MLPVREGMAAQDRPLVHHREKSETEFARIGAFSDGVFAIAITLLVLALEIPENVDLGEAIRERGAEFFAYFLSFAVVGRFWMDHHRFFGSVARYDSKLVAINLAHLSFVALLPFTSEVLGEYDNDSVAVAMYGANLALASATFLAVVVYAFREGLVRDEAAPYEARFAGVANLAVVGVFAVSVPLAFLSPTIATISWISLFFLGDRVADRVTGIRAPR